MGKWGRVLLMAGLLIAAGAAWMGLDMDGSGESAGGVRQVTDTTGTVVTLPAKPQRVVILNASNVDLYVAAGGRDTLAGRCDSQFYSEETAAAVKDIPSVGLIHQPNREAILAAGPDLVIGADVPYNVQLRDTLAQAGIPLYINGIHSYEDVLRTLTLYGELTGREEDAAASLAVVERAREEGLARTEGRQGPKAFILLRTPQGSTAVTSEAFAGDMLRMLGGQNPADGQATEYTGYAPLSTEFIIREDPEVLFILTMGTTGEASAEVPDELRGDPAWNGISAVKNDRIYMLPGELFLVNPGVRMADAFTYMAACLYPEEV